MKSASPACKSWTCADDIIRKYSESYEQAQIDRVLEEGRISNISIVQPATFDIKPVKPSTLLNLCWGSGSPWWMGLAVLLEQRRQNSSPAPQPSENGVPILAQEGRG